MTHQETYERLARIAQETNRQVMLSKIEQAQLESNISVLVATSNYFIGSYITNFFLAECEKIRAV